MNIVVFGGTFNPPHLGHLIIAEHVREKIGLDKILFVPSAVPPHKQDLDIVEAHHRLEMLANAIQGNRNFEICDLEIRRGGISFTVDTLTELRQTYSEYALYLMIGMDNWVEFSSWRSPEKIAGMAKIVVMTRPGVDGSQVDINKYPNAIICEVPEISIASSEIRKRVAEGKSIRYLVPTAVEVYIHKQRLYRTMAEE